MSAKECRKFYLKVRREAMRAARSWDLSPATIDTIRRGSTSCLNDWAVASFEVGDRIVEGQLVAAFTYATCIMNASLSFRADETVHTQHGTSVIMLDLKPPAAKEGGAE